jgi:hypothetical protein
MIRITAVAIAAIVFSVPALAQQKGRSPTAPGHLESGVQGATPGHSRLPGESAKDYAPGRDGGLTPPGSVQSQTPAPGKASGKK